MGIEYSPIPTPGLNASGESIPPRSFVKAGSGDEVEVTVGSNTAMIQVATAEKPDGASGAYFVTGPGTVADGSQVALYSPATPVWVKFSSAPSGTDCGPVNDSWEASDAGTGFQLHRYNSATGMGLVSLKPAISTSSPGSDPACEVGSPMLFSTDRFGDNKVLSAWDVTPIKNDLAEVDIDATFQDLRLQWASDNPTNMWQSAILYRVNPSGETCTDEYVLRFDEASWTLTLALVDGLGSGNCATEAYWVWKCTHTGTEQPDRTNEFKLFFGDGGTRTGEAYIDPPSRCTFYLKPTVPLNCTNESETLNFVHPDVIWMDFNGQAMRFLRGYCFRNTSLQTGAYCFPTSEPRLEYSPPIPAPYTQLWPDIPGLFESLPVPEDPSQALWMGSIGIVVTEDPENAETPFTYKIQASILLQDNSLELSPPASQIVYVSESFNTNSSGAGILEKLRDGLTIAGPDESQSFWREWSASAIGTPSSVRVYI